MKTINYGLGKISCISCPLGCEVKPLASLRVLSCQHYCFCTWPQESRYFSLGILEGVLKQDYRFMYQGCIFVDFSISFLRWFTEEKWVTYLSDTGLKIILVCDKHLAPLANYWFKHHDDIFLVSYQNDDLEISCERIKKRFLGSGGKYVKGESLSTLEFTILKALLDGKTCSTIAAQSGSEIRSIYAAKQRMEKKMNADINDLFRFSHMVNEAS